jgi:hypothetical protein
MSTCNDIKTYDQFRQRTRQIWREIDATDQFDFELDSPKYWQMEIEMLVAFRDKLLAMTEARHENE